MRRGRNIRGSGPCIYVVAERSEGDKPKQNGNLDALMALLGFTPLLSAALYLFGRAYDESYLLKLGLDPALLPIDFTDASVSGFITLWASGLSLLTYLVLAAEIVLIAVLLAGLVLSIRRVSDAFDRVQVRPFELAGSRERPGLKKAEGKAWRLFLVMMAIFGVFFGFGLLIISAGSAGEAKAKRELDGIQNGTKTLTEIQITDAGRPVQGFMVRCNGNYCGYLTPQGAFTVAAALVTGVRPISPPIAKPTATPASGTP